MPPKRTETSRTLSNGDPPGEICPAMILLVSRHTAARAANPRNYPCLPSTCDLSTRPLILSDDGPNRTETQLKDNLGARDWTITASEIERLDRASQTDLPYPAYFFRTMTGNRNPAHFPNYPA